MMTSREVRSTFLEYFAERGHRVVASSPLVLPGDPTLLFANAGMNQFKDVFTGREHRDYRRAASSQKCLRVSGKHNDLEMVGRTPRHHTFFEMLGNFSFGDYFKKDAIEFAWDLITRVMGIPDERLWVTVFGGSEAAGADDEAAAIWRETIGVRPDRILRLGEKENFWRMGDTGPCGPCSEIHFDLGEDLTSVKGESTPENDERRYVEIWNLVFMQFEQHGDGSQIPLPAPSVDTGMGLERIAAVLQGKRSNYDTDLFVPVLDAAAERAGTRYGEDSERDVSLQVIADHARALCFLVADGIIPANDSRGYVLRRVLRRAIRHGRKLGIKEPFLHEVTPAVMDGLGQEYPEILSARDAIHEISRREELRFAETITTGLQLLEQEFASIRDEGPDPVLPGKDLFRLYDTYGLPLDLARDIAEERGFRLDEDGFEEEMARQRARAQASWKGADRPEEAGIYADLAGSLDGACFVGYGAGRVEDARILALLRDGKRVERMPEGAEGEVVLENTPFYGEAGGQVGDTGSLSGEGIRAEVLDTVRRADGLVVSGVRVTHGVLEDGVRVLAEIDRERRDSIRRNHTATHLMHAALREVLGTHVKQAGSLVAADRLRFDFSHFSPVSDRALSDIESLVNRKILEAIPVTTEEMNLDEAVRGGAMALFGEKYEDRVRVVRIGDFSLELCGGTHVSNSSEIGLFKLVQERGIASGTRRVEAITGHGSLERFRQVSEVVRSLEEMLAIPGADLVDEVGRRLKQARALEKELEKQRLGGIRSALLGLAENAPEVAGVRLLTGRADGLKPGEMRELADNLRQKLRSGVVVLGRAQEGKASILVAVTADLTARIGAGDLVRELARIIGGGGGGRKDLAEAGGKSPERLDEALGAAEGHVTELLERSS